MPVVAHPVTNPYAMKTATVLFLRDGVTAGNEDDFSDHIGDLTLTPTIPTGSWTGISGNVIQDTGTPTWSAGLGLVQDLADTGLLRWLLAHVGEECLVTATFKSGADPVEFTVILGPGVIGGAAGGTPVGSTVTLPVVGQPVWA